MFVAPARALPSFVWFLAASVICHVRCAAIDCDVARLKCSYRVGCGMALHNYVVGCSDVIAGRTTLCSDQCTRALIALTSTEEGQTLTRCDCAGNDFCAEAKRRVEVCRPEVTRATREGTVVSCSVGQLICAADPLCSTALEYYHRFCRPMIQGRKCPHRCNNSIAILNRQQKAAKLRTCVCDGTEDFDCAAIKANMDRLCFRRNSSLAAPVAPSAAPSPDGPIGGPACALLFLVASVVSTFSR